MLFNVITVAPELGHSLTLLDATITLTRKYKGELIKRLVRSWSLSFFIQKGHPMTRFTPVSLFFFLAALALISHAFTLPLLRRDNISELKAAIQLATSDVATLSQQISIASWAYTLAPVRVSNLQPLI